MIKIYPAPDLPGQWVAHDTESDVITQGNTRQHAKSMLTEAIQLINRKNRTREVE